MFGTGPASIQAATKLYRLAHENDPKVALGDTRTSTPLSPSGDNVGTDALLQSILAGAQGGPATATYFDQVNKMGQVYAKLGQGGNNAWEQGSDKDGNPVHYVEELDASGNAYYIKVALEGVQTDSNGNIVPNGTKVVVNGVTYSGVGYVSQTCGYKNFEFAKISRTVGIGSAVSVAAKIILPYIITALKACRTAIGNAISKLFAGKPPTTPEDIQAEKTDAETTGESDILEEGGGEVTLEAAGTGGAEAAAGIAAGTVFIGVAVALAIVFIALSFIVHNSYHQLRVWNMTKYTISWHSYIDVNLSLPEGQFTSAPFVVNSDGSQTPINISGANCTSGIPGVKGPPQMYYQDFSVASSSEIKGIGYALYLKLADPETGEDRAGLAVYYDIPLGGTNSTNLTFEIHPGELEQWYKASQGDNQNTSARAEGLGPDGKQIYATSSYDYLTGEHGVPGQTGGSSNEAYYYQSLLCIVDPNLTVSELPTAPL